LDRPAQLVKKHFHREGHEVREEIIASQIHFLSLCSSRPSWLNCISVPTCPAQGLAAKYFHMTVSAKEKVRLEYYTNKIYTLIASALLHYQIKLFI